jgi:hypothetical protein
MWIVQILSENEYENALNCKMHEMIQIANLEHLNNSTSIELFRSHLIYNWDAI